MTPHHYPSKHFIFRLSLPSPATLNYSASLSNLAPDVRKKHRGCGLAQSQSQSQNEQQSGLQTGCPGAALRGKTAQICTSCLRTQSRLYGGRRSHLKLDFCLGSSITSESSWARSDKNKEQRCSVCKPCPTGKSAGNSLGLCILPALHSAGSLGRTQAEQG